MCHVFPPVAFFAITLVMSVTESAPSEKPDRNTETSTEFVTLLKQGQETGKLPAGVVIRLEAHLSHRVPADRDVRAEFEAKGVDFSRRRDEVWEFSGNRVHKATMKADTTGTKRLYERVDSASFKTQKLCRALREADILSLADRQGLGPHHFAGTGYDQGERAIEFHVRGKLVFSVGESCVEPGFNEKDAQAFSRLYESLADEARQAFLKKKVE